MRYQRHRFSTEIQEQIRQLNSLDNWHAPMGYARDIAVIVVACWLCLGVSWWCYPAALFLIGSRQRAFSNLLHESAHGMLARSRTLNLTLGTVLTAYPILQLHYGYKRSHLATHHPYLGDEGKDPDLVYFLEQGVYRSASERALWLRLAVLPAIGSRVVSHFWFLLQDRLSHLGLIRPQELSRFWRIRMRRDRIAFGCFWIAALMLAWASGNLRSTLLLWLVPYFTAFQILGWYIELSEHTPMVRVNNIDLHMTRNRKSRGLEQFLTGTYADHRHLDHHLDPRTPFWNLSRARDIRMSDPDYAAVDARFGGLFIKGRQGQPGAISVLIRELAQMSTPSPDRTPPTRSVLR
jgi:fatty acid desaturase